MIEDFDAMSDDAFTDFVYERARPDFSVDSRQREAMVQAHEEWVSSMEDDMRSDVDWSTATHSDWDLYAELRMNGVGFERTCPMELQLR